jgi:hypothetical protein
MTTLLLTLLLIAIATASICYVLKYKAETALEKERKQASAEISRMAEEAAAATNDAEALIKRKTAELDAEAQIVRQHYEAESRKIIEQIYAELEATKAELEPLRSLSELQRSEEEVRHTLASALSDAAAMQSEAKALVEQARHEGLDERKQAHQRAKELYQQGEALLAQATRDAGRIVADAEARALQIGGDAYIALRDKEMLDQAVKAIHNVIEGYGDRYIIPTHSLLDDLASDFGHTSAGEALRAAREQSRRMVTEGLAATCDYAEANRRGTAIRFVIDAFNGRVDAILSRVKHNNFGTLEQEVRDAFSLVNLNGEAFRNARVQASYCDARIAELRWAVILQELKLKEREEQRRIQEQIREEEKAKRDYERAMQEAAREEEMLRKAMERASAEAASASAEDRSKFEARLDELNQKLADAEAKNQRALSMAQQTRSGHVYIISNIGSFGDDVLKIGMTRRLEPDDRIKELGDASVPFTFDVHAMIRSDDAPSLERLLHERFENFRVNKVNYRKEFFRVPIQALRECVAEMKLEASFTMTAEAREYRETLAFEKMGPEQQQKFHVLEHDLNDGEE